MHFRLTHAVSPLLLFLQMLTGIEPFFAAVGRRGRRGWRRGEESLAEYARSGEIKMTQTVDIKKEVGTVEGGGMGVASSLPLSLSLVSASKPVLGTKNGLSGGKGEDAKTHTLTHSHLPILSVFCRTIIIFILETGGGNKCQNIMTGWHGQPA